MPLIQKEMKQLEARLEACATENISDDEMTQILERYGFSSARVRANGWIRSRISRR